MAKTAIDNHGGLKTRILCVFSINTLYKKTRKKQTWQDKLCCVRDKNCFTRRSCRARYSLLDSATFKFLWHLLELLEIRLIIRRIDDDDVYYCIYADREGKEKANKTLVNSVAVDRVVVVYIHLLSIVIRGIVIVTV
jgi:hypothetical protein